MKCDDETGACGVELNVSHHIPLLLQNHSQGGERSHGKLGHYKEQSPVLRAQYLKAEKQRRS